MANTGFKKYLNRAVYIGGVFQYNEPNTQFLPEGGADPNYIAPVQDLTTCPTSVTVYSKTLQATNSGVPVCATSGSSTYYADNNAPTVGTQFYTDSNGTTKWTGGNGNWWGINSTSSRLRIANGIVSATSGCF